MAVASTTITGTRDTVSICLTAAEVVTRCVTVIAAIVASSVTTGTAKIVDGAVIATDIRGADKGYSDSATPGTIGWPERNAGRVRDGDDRRGRSDGRRGRNDQ